MRLIDTPENFHNESAKQPFVYDNFFSFSFTQRNWVGKETVTREMVNSFISDFQVLLRYQKPLFQDFCKDKSTTFLFDLSLFSKPFDVTYLTSFLSDYDSSERNQRKLLQFSKKDETLPVLFYWAHTHFQHPGSVQMVSVLNQELKGKIDFFDAKLVNLTFRKVDQKSKSNKELIFSLLEHSANEIVDEVALQYHKIVESFISKVFTYAFLDPFYLIYAIYVVKYLFHHLPVFNGNPEMFVHMQKEHQNATSILFHRDNGRSSFLLSSYAYSFRTLRLKKLEKCSTLNENEFPLDLFMTSEEKMIQMDVFHKLALWCVERISLLDMPKDFKKSWFHEIENEWIIEHTPFILLFLENIRQLGNKTVLTMGAFTIEKAVFFPVFEPSTWDATFSLTEYALMTYTLCLYHDVCLNHTCRIVPNRQFPLFRFQLYSTPNKFVNNSQKRTSKTISKISSTSTKNENEVEEAWVTFYFRRLPPNQKASKNALERAKAYGFHDLPIGSTFVDSYVRGGRDGNSSLRISAVDVLQRTLKKMRRFSPSHNR